MVDGKGEDQVVELLHCNRSTRSDWLDEKKNKKQKIIDENNMMDDLSGRIVTM